MSARQSGRLRRAGVFLRPHRASIAVLLSLAFAGAGLNAVEPLLLKRLFDELGGDQRMNPLVWALVGLGGLALVREVTVACSNWLGWRTRLRIHYSLTEATVGRLHTLPMSFHRGEGVGGTMTRLDRGIQGFVTALTELAFQTVPALAYLLVAVVLMLQLDWRLGLLVMAFAPLPAVFAALAAPRQTRRERDLLDRWIRIYSRFNEVLSGILTVKSFAAEEREKRRFLTDVDEANQVVTRGIGFDSGVGAAQSLAAGVARLAAIALGCVLVVRGQIGLGTVVAFLGYLSGLFGPVQNLSNLYKTLQTGSVALDEVFSILDTQDTLGDAPHAVDLGEVKGELAFEQVRFGYEADKPVLDGVDLHIKPGEYVALVGPSGSGKSTTMALLQRFYDPDSGRVLIDGHDLRDVKQASLRRAVGVVLQDPLLFNESVRANLAYGRPEATFEELVEAAKAANAHEFIQRLPEGYDTVVGERGGRLSFGERQRIAIARSLIKDPPILILDEPTSALDAESEALVQEALQRLTKGRTVISIAHRLSTVLDADRILVLAHGRIVEAGPHDELVEKDGMYASLVRRQFRNLLRAA